MAHCGESTEGLYLNILSAVDVATGWVECQGVRGKGQQRVGGAIHEVAGRLPFLMLGLDSDNGSEFINNNLYAYCQQKKITFTRSRPYKTTAPTWNRRTGRRCAAWWATTATPPERLWASSTGCTSWHATTSISSSPPCSYSTRAGTGPRSTKCMMSLGPLIEDSWRQVCWRGNSRMPWQSSIKGSIRCVSSHISTKRSSNFGRWQLLHPAMSPR